MIRRRTLLAGALAVPGLSIGPVLTKTFQGAIGRAVEYGIVSRRFDVRDAIDHRFVGAA